MPRDPLDALRELAPLVNAEICRHHREDNGYYDLTVVFMSLQTFQRLSSASKAKEYFDFYFYSFYIEAFQIPAKIVSGFNTANYTAHVVLNPELPFGRVSIKHFSRKDSPEP